MNILTQVFQTSYNSAPFSKIKIEDYPPAFEANIAAARAEIDAITQNPAAPTFENTIEALEFSGQALDRLSSIFFNLNSAETNDELQKIAQEVSPLLTAFSNDISLNETCNSSKAALKKTKKCKKKRNSHVAYLHAMILATLFPPITSSSSPSHAHTTAP